MAFMTNNAESIMTSRAARKLLEEMQRRLALRMSDMESRDYLALLHRVRDELLREESVDTGISAEIEALRARLGDARLVDDLVPLCSQLSELAVRHFQARSSVSMLQEFTCSFLETLLCTVAKLAEEQLRLEGYGRREKSWSLFASDCLGRQEATQGCSNAILLIHDEHSLEGNGYFRLMASRLMAILNECSMPMQRGLQRNGNIFWSGSLDEWRDLLGGSLNRRQPARDQANTQAYNAGQEEIYARTLEIMADLRPICGDNDLALQTLELTWGILDKELQGENFRQFARRTATMPVALGIFGRFRTARTGKHRGEFSLEELALMPLIASVRAMAIASGIRETATTARIKALMVAGSIGVTLADRLLLGLYDFIRHQIEMDMNRQVNGDEHFFNPDQLTDDAKDRFKAGLEDLTTLQRLLYQQIVEVD